MLHTMLKDGSLECTNRRWLTWRVKFGEKYSHKQHSTTLLVPAIDISCSLPAFSILARAVYWYTRSASADSAISVYTVCPTWSMHVAVAIVWRLSVLAYFAAWSWVCVPTMANKGDSEDSNVQLSGHSAIFRSDMDVFSLSMFLGDNGIPSDICEVFEGKLPITSLSIQVRLCMCNRLKD